MQISAPGEYRWVIMKLLAVWRILFVVKQILQEHKEKMSFAVLGITESFLKGIGI